jgi:hypothetical protein
LRFIDLAQFDRLLKLGIAGHGIPAVTHERVLGHDLLASPGLLGRLLELRRPEFVRIA